MTKPSSRARHIAGAGKMLFGDARWQSPLARLVGISPTLMQKIADGSRDVTDDVLEKVRAALALEAVRLRSVADKIEAI